MSVHGLFVTGTDTGVGKTVVACALVRGAAAAPGLRVAVMKPVASGALRTPAGLRNEDALALACQAARTSAAYEDVNPYCFEPPFRHISPPKRSRSRLISAGSSDDYGGSRPQADWVVVEGAGGWLAPISDRETMADLALALGVPALLVVGLKLGCLNHARLTRRAHRGRGVGFAGWVASAVDPQIGARGGEPRDARAAPRRAGARRSCPSAAAALRCALEEARRARAAAVKHLSGLN